MSLELLVALLFQRGASRFPPRSASAARWVRMFRADAAVRCDSSAET